ncbi:redoxin domain-containing protein [archaeon]|nr:MAG: redoxin domain-containing protein [archaeon]
MQGGLGDMAFPLLADFNKTLSRDFGVLIENAKDDMHGVSVRGTFIVDPKGIIRSAHINDAPVGRSVEETLRTLKALQFADEHGDVCPAGWTPGAATMKADPVGSQEYFSKLK